MTVDCCNPVVILNPHLRDLILKYRYYYMDDSMYYLSDCDKPSWYDEFPYARFNYVKFRLAQETHNGSCPNLDKYYIAHEDGEKIPMFFLVPCGKCPVCQNKKKLQWMFRAAAESKYSSTVPLFVTVTYDDQHLPVTGLQKRDVQLFLKRLRKAIVTRFGESTLRYFCVGEYGKQTHRAHYHFIFWNFPPVGSYFQLKQFIIDSWQQGVIVDIKYLDGRYKDKYSKPDGAVGYTMKYMFKECPHVPPGCNPVFWLSSRRGGIGYQFRDDMEKFIVSDSRRLQLSVTDPWTGKQYRSFIIPYFKRKYYPTLSIVLSKTVRDSFARYIQLQNALRLLRCAVMRFRKVSLPDWCTHDSIDYDLLRKYDFLPVLLIDYSYDSPDITSLLRRCSHSFAAVTDLYQPIRVELESLYSFLMAYPFDTELWHRRMRSAEEFKNSISINFGNLPLPNPNYRAEIINKYEIAAELREKF